MNLQTYLKNKQQREVYAVKTRNLCSRCVQPDFACYCSSVKSIDVNIKFVILIHPIEVRRRIATGRMSHLCLQNSELISGESFANSEKVNELIATPESESYILYPSKQSLNLSEMSFEQKTQQFSQSKNLNLFIIDGTWATAQKMIRRSENLLQLKQLCFVPQKTSQFKVRKQPSPECLSTIEAIHQSIELLGESRGFDVESRQHDHLLEVFNAMVTQQVELSNAAFEKAKPTQYRRPKFRVA